MNKCDSLKIITLSAVVSVLSACGGGGGGGSPAPAVQSSEAQSVNTGVLLDSAVANIAYRTETQEGFTSDKGEYLFLTGETVTFSIGGIDLSPTPAKGIVTPLDIMNVSSVNDLAVVNLSRFLQSIDKDGNPDNGIQIGSQAHVAAASMTIDFKSEFFDVDVKDVVANSGSVNTVLIDPAAAIAHLSQTLSEIGVETEDARYIAASVKQQFIAPGSQCIAGGIEISTGFDGNQNGQLDQDEISETQIVCHGASGVTSLLNVSDIVAGNQCPISGKEIATGLDQNSDGVLQEAEINQRAYLCDNNLTTDQLRGYNALINLVEEPVGLHCAAGGQKIESGQDLNRDGVLQSSEVIQFRYVCNGITPPELGKSLVRLTEDGGNLCLHAGTITSIGNDSNGNDVLDDSEVTSSSYLCRDNSAPYLLGVGLSAKDSNGKFPLYAGVGKSVAWSLSAADRENDAITVSTGQLPSWLKYEERIVDISGCLLSSCIPNYQTVREFVGTPEAGHKGSVEVSVTLTDGEKINNETLIIQVAEPVVFSINDNVVVTEGVDTHADMELSLSAAVGVDIDIWVNSLKPFQVCDNSGCVEGINPITLTAGETNKTIRFDITDDIYYSSGFDTSIAITNSSTLEQEFVFQTGEFQTRTISIIDNDPKPVVGFTAKSSSSSALTQYISIPLNLSEYVANGIQASFEFGGTAVRDVDYLVQYPEAHICCSPGQSGFLNIQLINDSIATEKTVEITISTLQGDADIDPSNSLHKVILTPPVYPEINFVTATSSVSYYSVHTNFEVTASEAVEHQVHFNISYSGPGLDYIDQNTLLTQYAFYPGQISQTIPLQHNGSSIPEDVQLTMNITNPTGGVLGAISSHTVTLLNSQPYGVKQISPILENGSLQVTSTVIDGSGFIYMIGNVQGTIKGQVYFGGNSDFFIAKFKEDGELVWVKQLGSAIHDTADDITLDHMGNILLLRSSMGGGVDEHYLEKYSNSGEIVWQQTLNGDFSSAKLISDNASNVIITIPNHNPTMEDGDNFSNGFYIEKRSSSGTLLWKQNDLFEINSSNYWYGSSNLFSVDAAGDVYMAATSSNDLAGEVSKGSNDIAIIKFSGDTGVSVWGRMLGSSESDGLKSLETDNTGNVFVSGNASTGFEENLPVLSSDIVMAKLDSDGATVWTKQIGSFSSDSSGRLISDGADGFYLAAQFDGEYQGSEAGNYLFHFDGSGSQVAKVSAASGFDIDGFYYWSNIYSYNAGMGVSDSGDIYMYNSSHTSELSIRKFDSALSPL